MHKNSMEKLDSMQIYLYIGTFHLHIAIVCMPLLVYMEHITPINRPLTLPTLFI